MRLLKIFLLLISMLLLFGAGFSENSNVKLTVVVEGVNKTGGTIGVYVFRSEKGWPESSDQCFRRIVVPAHPGIVRVEVPDLPAGTYAVAVGHDSNLNHHVDKNWLGKPTEQWGLSNNPHVTLKAPGFSKAQFALNSDTEIHIQLR